ncbi:hypothetical protein NPX13_g6459 [Xylaria arbuscula]|uniref:Protein kinase domain-containing protein n=1 Tax=Xylaria arbuscula TaxID=114810 RepID=A0A9W8NCU1_9PEZI|nr:hypothetical protein NPX13_g6459 [Xylaria arbuscula]
MAASLTNSGVSLSFAAYISDISAHQTKFRSLTLPTPEDQNNTYPQLPVAELAVLIQKLWIRGPCFTVSPSRHIGSGAQFVVRQGSIGFFSNPSAGLRTVALKTPKFVLDAEERLDLSESAVRRQVRDFLIEIAALRHPNLRRHENIVNIVGWGIDEESWHRPPFIALELADDDLAGILSSSEEISSQMKFDLIKDIAAALDVIHEIGLIHGDLKLENILVFKRKDRWIAKLSDFGSGADLSKGAELVGRGTVGWRAPELRRHYEEGDFLDPLFLDRLDAYAFGLVSWAIVCDYTTSPPGAEEEDVLNTAMSSVRSQEGITSEFTQSYAKLLGSCLCKNPRERPQRMLPLLVEESNEETPVTLSPDLSNLTLDDDDVDAEIGNDDCSTSNSSTTSVLSSDYQHWNWELPDLEVELLHPLIYAFLESEESLSPETAFAVFLKWVEGGPGPTDEPTASAPWARLLRAAAIGGVQQARALIFRYYEFHGYEINEDIETKTLEWGLESYRYRRFDILSGESGGFNQHYSDMSPEVLEAYLDLPPGLPPCSKTLYEPLNRWGDCLPHILASFNHPEAISILKTIMQPICVNVRNNLGETPLYRACLCGSSETVLFLLDIGANPSLRPRRKAPSCLHWLFAFHPDDVQIVATKLIEKGASTDVLTSRGAKMFHYPFLLPAGSPLRWAVHFRCLEAVRILLSFGADPFLRGGDRQFIFLSSDPDIRPDSPDDIPHEEFILGPSAGASAVEIAVQNWDADTLELLLERHSSAPNDTLADGIGILHHLTAGDFCWISDYSPSRFYTPYVRGPPDAQNTMLKRTLQVLLDHGFEIDALAPAWRSGRTSTALMLAVYAGKPDLVELLLSTGADVNASDSDGRTALMYMGVRYGVEASGSPEAAEEFQTHTATLLLRHGANIHVRDAQGYSPLLTLSSRYLRAAVKILLDSGAAVGDKTNCPEYHTEDVADFPVFGHLTWALSNKLDEGIENTTCVHDQEMAALLRTYVVPLISEHHGVPREYDRKLLLHELAICGLVESATVLLQAGVAVNPVEKKKGKTPRTPLDALLNFMDIKAREAGRGVSKAG